MSNDLRVAIAGGGTGGHIFPGIALADALVANNSDVFFLGCEGGMEERLLDGTPYDLELLPSPKARGRGFRRLLGIPGQFMLLSRAVSRARAILREKNVNVLVGTGGYASAAPVIASSLLGLPTVLLEQNAIPGRTNRFLARWASEVHTQYAESVARFPDPDRVIVSGNPIRKRILQAGMRLTGAPHSAAQTLLIIGGSQGAQALNQAVCTALQSIAVPCLEVVHLTGTRDVAQCSQALSQSGLRGRAIPFCADMAPLYRQADLVLCRSGATSLAEIAALGLPSLLVPYPYAADNHQEANAKILVDAGAAEVIPETELPVRLASTVTRLLLDDTARRRMSRASLGIGRPDAADTIARRVVALASTVREKRNPNARARTRSDRHAA